MTQLSVLEKYQQREVVDFWREFSLHGLQAGEEMMMERYAPGAGDVLDLGCGSGRAILALEPRGYRVTGLDITWEMVEAAQELCVENGLEPRLAQADMRMLPYASESYDVTLVFIAALQHIAERRVRQAVFAEMARVTRPGGVLILALDNLAPALYCYFYWGVRKLASLFQRPAKSRAETGKVSETLPVSSSSTTSADSVLTSKRGGMRAIGWHLRGVARTLRWRSWTNGVDWGRRLGLVGGEVGDTHIYQVSMNSTAGKVFYHLYRHEELVADARAGGLVLLGFHSGEELRTGRGFSPFIRVRDKQILYAFRKGV